MVLLSTSFLFTKPGEKMGMYLCARDIDLSSFYTFSIDLARRENGHVFVVQKEETSISLAHKYMTILSPGLVNRKGAERGNIDISSTLSMFPLSTPFLLTKPGERMDMYLCTRDIDLSSFYTFSIDLHSLSWLGQ
jgi:hypothetical protein